MANGTAFVNTFVRARAGAGPADGGAGAEEGDSGDGPRLPPLAIWGTLRIYAVAWALLTWPEWLPLGRPSIAILFATIACGLRAACGAAWPEQGYPGVDIWGKVDPTPIALLFGLMLVNAYLKDTGVWIRVGQLLDAPSPTRLLLKVCGCSALLSALLLNDTTCFVLTPVVLELCARRGARTALPYLLAVSMSANIGSSLTTIGNPQNARIAAISPGITFLGFMRAMLAPVAAGLVMNTAALWLWFRRNLIFERTEPPQLEAEDAAKEVDVATLAAVRAADPEVANTIAPLAHAKCVSNAYSVAVGVLVCAMILGWLLGLAEDDVALAAGCMLMLVRAARRRLTGQTRGGERETEFALGAVDYIILILFIGQFILVGATVDTGLPQRAFRFVLGPCADDVAVSRNCLLWFAGIVLVLSNLISNVPVILMLQPLLASQPSASMSSVWVLCALVATVSGNLTMLGSAANLIVAHAAEARGERSFTATNMGKFSFFPTLVVATLGVFLMPPVGPDWAWRVPCAAAVAAMAAAVAVLGLIQNWRGLRRRCERRLPPAPKACVAADSDAAAAASE